jgi:hypothetical protein
VSTKQLDAQLGRRGYSIYPLPTGWPFHPYADFDHQGAPELDGLDLPAPTEQQWLELNRLAPLAEQAGFWVTLTQLGPGAPLRLTTTKKGSQVDEAGLQWCDTEPFKAYHRAGHYLRRKFERKHLNALGAEQRAWLQQLEAPFAPSPAAYLIWVRETLEPWQAWALLEQWEAATKFPDYCFALRQYLVLSQPAAAA